MSAWTKWTRHKIRNISLHNVFRWNRSILSSPNRVKTGASLTPDVGLLCLGEFLLASVVDPQIKPDLGVKSSGLDTAQRKTNILPTTNLLVPEGSRAILYRQTSPQVEVCLDQAHKHRLNVFCREVHGKMQKPTRSQSGAQHLPRELQQ